MKYNLVLDANVKNLNGFYNLAKCEEGDKNRSSISISKKSDKVRFEINAKDAVALKASFNHIQKIITIYEKTQEMVKNG